MLDRLNGVPARTRVTKEIAMSLPSYAVLFRGYWACPCLAEWLPVLEAELQRRGILTGPLHIYQLIGDAAASGNTHKDGGAADLLDLPGDEDWWVIRQMGADAGWSRRYNWDGHGGMAHFHLVLRGCPHNEPARYQYDSPYYGVDHGHNGLANGGLDDGPRPLSGRTWRQGIEWAKQQEDEMKPEDFDKIRAIVAAETEKAVEAAFTKDQKNGRNLRANIVAIARKVGVVPIEDPKEK